ncbi:MAG: TlpA disulfide reductase family protein [Candidatus Korobacteraceae bacterium]
MSTSLTTKRVAIWLVVFACLAGVYIYSRRHTPRPQVTTSSNSAPNFTVNNIDGKKLSLSDYKGKVVLLDFWATWCTPCRAEIPHFVEMQEKYGPQGFQVIGISMDDDAKPVREFYQQYKMNYPVAVGDDKLADRFGGVMGLPVNFVIDREGRIHSKHLGATDVSVFDEEVTALLKRQ